MEDLAVDLDRATKAFGRTVAVRDLTLRLPAAGSASDSGPAPAGLSIRAARRDDGDGGAGVAPIERRREKGR